MNTRIRRQRLYRDGQPVSGFNGKILEWLRNETQFADHAKAAAFEPIRTVLDCDVAQRIKCGATSFEAHRHALSHMTNLLLGIDLNSHLGDRLAGTLLNNSGFRSALSQGAAKNNGENFVNAIVYSLAEILQGQDEILVDKGTPPGLREALCLTRTVSVSSIDVPLQIRIPIECDFAIYQRSNPTNAIVVSAKTRLKEVFHVGTMWKILFDMIGDGNCEEKWGVTSSGSVENMHYCFATADMIPPGAKGTQGGDVEREMPRNLIAMDASFFDYVFVSKSNISHVSDTLSLAGGREALFHELGCLVDLIEQKFGVALCSPTMQSLAT